MDERQKQDSREMVDMLADLPKEDRQQVRGVIAGFRLARGLSPSGNQPPAERPGA